MAAMASLAAVAASASFAPSVSISFSGLRAGRALAPAAAFPRLRLGARPRSMPLRIRAEAGGNKTFVDVQKIIAEQLAVDKEKIKIESEFGDLGADSLDTVEIMMALEEKFDIQLDADQGESIKTVQDVVGLIEDTIKADKKKKAEKKA